MGDVMSYSYTTDQTFSRVNAKYLATKVAADLHLFNLYYGYPVASDIPAYLEELTELLADEYVAAYEFGFKRDEKRVIAVRYTVTPWGQLVADDPAGRVFATADTSGARYYNYLTHNQKWFNLAPEQRSRIEAACLFRAALLRCLLTVPDTGKQGRPTHRMASLCHARRLDLSDADVGRPV